MSSRRASSAARAPAPDLAAEVRRQGEWQANHDERCAERYDETRKAYAQVVTDIGGLRDDIRQIHGLLLKGPNLGAPAKADEEGGGLPFKHGWRSWLVVGVAVLTGLGTLKAAMLAMDAAWSGVATAWRALTQTH